MLIDVDLIRFILKFQAFNTIILTDVVTEDVLLPVNVYWRVNVFPVDLLGLLNWRSNPEDLEQILQRLMEVEGGEIVKVRYLCVEKLRSTFNMLLYFIDAL